MLDVKLYNFYVIVYFGFTAPEGKESNWIQTVPKKAWFDKTWQLSDLEVIK